MQNLRQCPVLGIKKQLRRIVSEPWKKVETLKVRYFMGKMIVYRVLTKNPLKKTTMKAKNEPALLGSSTSISLPIFQVCQYVT